MEIYFEPKSEFVQHADLVSKKVDDEAIVRKALIKIWTRLLEQYARPGVPIPSLEDLRGELLHEGVEAAIRAVVKAHWCVFDWMIRDEIERKVKEGLDRCELGPFRDAVLAAQSSPSMLPYLREWIRQAVMN